MAASVESTLVNIYSQPNVRGLREMAQFVASAWKEEAERLELARDRSGSTPLL
jgi:hypothetical protein